MKPQPPLTTILPVLRKLARSATDHGNMYHNNFSILVPLGDCRKVKRWLARQAKQAATEGKA